MQFWLTILFVGLRTNQMETRYKASLQRKDQRDIVHQRFPTRSLLAWSLSKFYHFFHPSLTFSCNIEFKDVFVPDANRMAKADDFEKGLNAMLMASRLTITWISIGAIAGCFEKAYQYTMNRQQFGRPLAGFQLQQERLVRMLGEIESCITILIRVCQLFERGKATMGQVAMCKAHCSRVARDVARTAREMMGANGILWENLALKHMIDLEAGHTGEGTYDVNVLVSGRELTGLAAFK